MIKSNYKWRLNAVDINPSEIDTYSTLHATVHPVILRLLEIRGVKSPEQIKRFLNPKLEHLYNPMLLKDMDKAVARIKKALSKGEKITVYGDYDVDGITSCCMLVRTLREMGGNVDYYIPSRLDEGYGLNCQAIENIYRGGTTLIVTVDNGINSLEEINFATELGIDVVVTDHHEPQDTVPDAIAIVNPKQKNCKYPFKNLAGVGVVLKLVMALTEYDEQFLIKNLDLAALGTVADLVPLIDENRIIVKNGLDCLDNTANKGIVAMKSVLNITSFSGDTTKISYLLAPRLNAVGRIANADPAIELLLTEDEAKALQLAQDLEHVNQERQAMELAILNSAKKMLEQDSNLSKNKVIVLSSPDWHPGVIGIVASKLMEIYHKPCILICEDGDEGKGSGRSFSGFNIFKALSCLSHLLEKFGGHEYAVGFSLKVKNIPALRQQINDLAQNAIKPWEEIRWLEIDTELKGEDINLDLAKQIELLSPFGYGNPKPVFVCRKFSIDKIQTVGNQDKHLKLLLKRPSQAVQGIGFNLGNMKPILEHAPIIDVAFNLEVNRWRDIEQLQLNIKDIKLPYLEDELMQKLEHYYYKKFFTNLSKDSNWSLLCLDQLKSTNRYVAFRNQGSLEKNDLIKEYLLQNHNLLIIVNTPYQAWHLLNCIKENEEIKSQIGIFYSMEEAEKTDKKNAIIINPCLLSEPHRYEEIIFYDTPFNEHIFKEQNYCFRNFTRHILFEKKDLTFNHIVCQKILPDIDGIRIVYKVVEKITSGRFLGKVKIKDLNQFVKNYFDIELHFVGFVNTFKIFKELGIIDFYIDQGVINITAYNTPKYKLNLEDSLTYRNIIALKRNLRKFERMFINVY